MRLAIGATVSQTIRAFYKGQLEYLISQGCEITVITAPDPTLQQDLPRRVRVHFVDFSRAFTPLRDLKTLLHLIGYFRRHRFDLLQYSTPKSSLLCSVAGWVARVPCRLYCMWGIFYSAQTGWKRALFRAVERLVCALSTHVSPDGKDNRAFAIAEGLCLESNSSIVGEGSANGIDLDRFDPSRHVASGMQLRDQLNIGPDGVVIGSVTRMVRDKGMEELIRAFEKLASENPLVHLLLVGPREDHRSPLDPATWRTIEQHNRIHWVGLQPDVPPYYAAMDLFVLPSYREGFGIVNLEAAAMNLPAISTDVNGPRESIVAEETGLLVPVAEVEPLYQAMKHLAGDRDLRKRMGESGRRRVVESFDARKMWKLWHKHRLRLLGLDTCSCKEARGVRGLASTGEGVDSVRSMTEPARKPNDEIRRASAARMKFAIIVPTKDRPKELGRFLRSVAIQDALPDQIVVVDGSDQPVRPMLEEFKQLPIDYLEVRPPGLVKQRHAGINALREDMTVFGFFDDDIVLEPGAFQAMQQFWENRFDEFGGFGLNLVNAGELTYRKHQWYLRLFMIRDDRKPGKVLRSCRSVPYCPCDVDGETEWLCGGATFWKREIFSEINYDPWFKGWGMSDDLEFSIRVRKKHRLAVVTGARAQHLETPTRQGRHFLRGYIGAMNTMRIANVHPEYSIASAGWSWFGQGLARVGHGMVTLNPDETLMGLGHIAAVFVGLATGYRSLESQVKN